MLSGASRVGVSNGNQDAAWTRESLRLSSVREGWSWGIASRVYTGEKKKKKKLRLGRWRKLFSWPPFVLSFSDTGADASLKSEKSTRIISINAVRKQEDCFRPVVL